MQWNCITSLRDPERRASNNFQFGRNFLRYSLIVLRTHSWSYDKLIPCHFHTRPPQTYLKYFRGELQRLKYQCPGQESYCSPAKAAQWITPSKLAPWSNFTTASNFFTLQKATELVAVFSSSCVSSTRMQPSSQLVPILCSLGVTDKREFNITSAQVSNRHLVGRWQDPSSSLTTSFKDFLGVHPPLLPASLKWLRSPRPCMTGDIVLSLLIFIFPSESKTPPGNC